ncbi:MULTISPECIES: twin-arginine translocation signal domain-containing protein [Novosphingobium]|uniref:Twin-arginine translocation pathway signal protein n=1 Tax=Novosphingobium subterraneum TaxID=48936 RepID=A0A0B8ZR75_9SPHN|nr:MULTISPECIES: twin-arginine translocation signal domain-containing protein [Novosphingobium]KHS48692.1 twin-arginine translocation pathway signal protein [Novosphingobium subterraneum]QOV93537.1 twin-arginine translocation signal domain-containing protein [Novosphingobium sp. ES2-1]
MRVSRRSMLKGSALAGAVAATPAVAAMASPVPLVVFDSRIPESAAFAAAKDTQRAIDLALGAADAARAIKFPQVVTGLTRWSDWTALRGVMEAQGLRLSDEIRAAAPLSGRTHLFLWTMTAR